MTDITQQHEKAKDVFFEQLIVLWKEYRWGAKLIRLVEEKCEFLPNYHLVLFPKGFEQVIEDLESWQDQKMLKILDQEETAPKVRAKIARALEVRLTSIVPKEVILKQNALFLLPSNLILAMKCSSRTCDLIWRYAGDKSDDFNYYTKRGLLLGVYASARLFYLSDNSPNFTQTKEFITSSLDNIINVTSLKNKIKLPAMEDIPILRMFW